MRFWYQRSHAQLAEYVRTVLILEGSSTFESDSPPLFTNGMPALYCRVRIEQPNNIEIKLTFYGVSSPPECWEVKESSTVVAYFFKPFALSTLFNISASRLVKAPIELNEWSAHKTNALRIQLMRSQTTQQIVDVVGHFLEQQLKQNERECKVVRYATDKIMINSSKEILSEILEDLSISERTFQRIFKKYTGITASQYRRICQFQLSFMHVRAGEFDKLSDVAFENGFSDQSHFIRSFKEFAQTTPNDYLKEGLIQKSEK